MATGARVEPGTVAPGADANATSSEARLTALVAALAFLLLLPFNHAHFKSSDELAVYEMTRSLYEEGHLAVPPLRHTAVGADGRRYSYFAPGQAVLALPFYAAGRLAHHVLPERWVRALAGPPIRGGVYHFGGAIESTFVGLYAPVASGLLVALFFAFQRRLGASRPTAFAVAMALATSTQIALHGSYFLRHTTESGLILGSFYGFFRFARGGAPRWLVLGASLAACIPLVRVPAAIAALPLGGYLAWALFVRSDGLRDRRTLLSGLACVTAPIAVAAALHGLSNEVRWGGWLASPMVDQQSRFVNPLGQGVAGLLVSPGSSVFAWSPLLLLAPFALASLARTHRAEALALIALASSLVLFYARFDGWSGLWSAPGPRYLVPLIPALLLPLGLWIDRNPRPGRWIAVAGLAVVGAFLQGVSLTIKWGTVPRLAGYPIDDPDHAGFLFDLAHGPIPTIIRLLFGGAPTDPWLLSLANGWPGVAAQPGTVALLLLGWSLALLACATASWRVLRGPPEPAP